MDVSNPEAVRQNLQEILKTPVSQPIGNTRELTPSTSLGATTDNRKEQRLKEKEKQKKKEEKPQKKNEEEEGKEEEKKPEQKKMVFSDRKDYIKHQIKVLKERSEKKDHSISAHRYENIFREKCG